ncbi:MAG: ROK family protein [Terriglobia bacterium]
MRKISIENTSAAGKTTIKETNEKLILNLIREHQPISRAQISDKTGLQRSTVTIITNRLLEQRWIYEGENGTCGLGRRPTNLYLNPNKLHVVGVEVGKKETVLALADMNGKLLKRDSMQTGTDASKLFRELAKKIRRLADESKTEMHIEVASAGMSLPGYIEKAAGRIIAAENFGWMNVPAGEYLREHLAIPVYFENNAKLSAFAEIWFGNKQENNLQNFLYVTTRDGIGTGIIINGEIYNGAHDGAAEFGHMSLFPYGERCVCGNSGCWEVYASDMATIKRYLQTQNGEKARKHLSEHLTIHDLIERAHAGEKNAQNALRVTAKYLGLGLANLVYGFNAELVIVDNNLKEGWDIIGDIVLSTVRSRVPSYYTEQLKIIPSSIKEIPTLLGAIALALAHSFKIAGSY